MGRVASVTVLILGGAFVLGFALGQRHARAHPAFIVWKLQTAKDPADRRAAAVELARSGEQRALLALIGSATMDPDSTVRNHCAGAISSFNTPQAIPALIALLHDQSLAVRTTAAMGLARLGEAALPELRAVYLSGHPASCMFAAIALSQIRDPRTLTIFEEGAASESAEVRKWAVQLGKQGELDRVLRELCGEIVRTETPLPAAEIEYLSPELLMIGVRKLEGTDKPPGAR